ncbi:hypothetical protein ACFU7X_32705 [Streptomyces chartreusis]|uniref:hypothetical protein n=1 Tax=Streptomyces chartreusis TaxID=1969 RepID=UPI00369D4D7D
MESDKNVGLFSACVDDDKNSLDRVGGFIDQWTKEYARLGLPSDDKQRHAVEQWINCLK